MELELKENHQHKNPPKDGAEQIHEGFLCNFGTLEVWTIMRARRNKHFAGYRRKGLGEGRSRGNVPRGFPEKKVRLSTNNNRGRKNRYLGVPGVRVGYKEARPVESGPFGTLLLLEDKRGTGPQLDCANTQTPTKKKSMTPVRGGD